MSCNITLLTIKAQQNDASYQEEGEEQGHWKEGQEGEEGAFLWALEEGEVAFSFPS